MSAIGRKVARLFGYDVMRLKKSSSFDATLDRLFTHHSFDAIIDVGANVGFLSKYTLAACPGVPVVSFEPAADLAADLTRQAAANPLWTVVQSALGDEEGQVTLYLSEKSVYNSLNAPAAEFAGTIGGLEASRTLSVPITTLDAYARANGLLVYSDMMIKIDTQGHDLKVLRGATETMSHAKAAIIELPFQNIYDSQDNYRDILDFMENAGFVLYAIAPISSDKTGALIEADGFFVRRHVTT